MKYSLTAMLFLLVLATSLAQPNCNYFKLNGEMKRYEACLEAEKAAGHYQFSKEYQQVFDRVIQMDPTWAYPYRAKSVAYLKSGDFIEWKKLIDKAVEYDTLGYLEYRGWCRYQFFRDYKGAIEDLLLLKKLTNNDMGISVNGHYHLDIALALCYKAIGKTDLAIDLILEKLGDETYFVGVYDQLHLGVMYLEKGNYAKAIEFLDKQKKINDLSENRYYAALAHKALNQKEAYVENLSLAREYYQNKQRMHDVYTHHMDKVYMSTIENEERNGAN
ncbi:tetratricopeptide repeat protein [Litoribacter populi]|uniref:tetratricopeptide repeat protein n=1 Tax=Litoribacter populi TaxID=2598460 RepID=UPI00117DFABB|nr:hypothetical protein [Litoribacter populi]